MTLSEFVQAVWVALKDFFSARPTCHYCEIELGNPYRRWIGVCEDCCYRMEHGGQPLTKAMREEHAAFLERFRASG